MANSTENGVSPQQVSFMQLPSEALDELRKAVESLYDAAMAAPPEELLRSSVVPEEVDDIVSRSLKWQHDVARKFGLEDLQVPNHPRTFTAGSLLAAIYANIPSAAPVPTAESQRPVSGDVRPIAPYMFLGEPPRNVMVDQRLLIQAVVYHEETLTVGMGPIPVPNGDWTRLRAELQREIIQSRQRALALIQWTMEGIRRYESMVLPYLHIGPEVNRRALIRVTQAGHCIERGPVQMQCADFLWNLARQGRAVVRAEVKSKLIHSVPELRDLIKVSKIEGESLETGENGYVLVAELTSDSLGKPRITRDVNASPRIRATVTRTAAKNNSALARSKQPKSSS